jgi:hypothetical protein
MPDFRESPVFRAPFAGSFWSTDRIPCIFGRAPDLFSPPAEETDESFPPMINQLSTFQDRCVALYRRAYPQRASLFVNLIDLAAIVFGLGWIFAILLPHFQFIGEPACQEINETACWYPTWLLANHRNPFGVGELPGAAYSFSPLYNYIVLLFRDWLGIGFGAHRFLNLVFLIGVFAVIARHMRRLGSPWGIISLSIALLYFHCFRNVMITTRPDTLGWLLFLLALLEPWAREYRPLPSWLGLAASLLGFYCKGYFLLGAPIIFWGIYWFRSSRDAIRTAAIFTGVFLLVLWIVDFRFPLFLIESTIVQGETAKLNSHGIIAWDHAMMLFREGWPFLALMIVALLAWVSRVRFAGAWQRLKQAARFGKFDPAERPMFVMGTVFAGLFPLVCLLLGRNGGASFTYHLHLLYPLMFVLSAGLLSGVKTRLVFTAAIALSLHLNTWIPNVPHSYAGHQHLVELMKDKHDVVATPLLMDIVLDQGRRVYYNGNTNFLPAATQYDWAQIYPASFALQRRYEDVQNELHDGITAHRFDAVFLLKEMGCEPFTLELLAEHYVVREEVPMPVMFDNEVVVQVWTPK